MRPVAKKKQRARARPAKRSEPTTAQLRQEYYRRRAEEQALERLGLKLDERPTPKGAAGWWADARDALDRLEIIHAVWRWVGVTGTIPEPEDWDQDGDWPTVAEVEHAFGSWEAMLDSCGLEDSVIGEILERALAADEKLAAREAELQARERKLEEESRKIAELRRREEVARAKREEADAARQEAVAARDAAVRERDALAERVSELERELQGLRAAAEAKRDAPPAEAELVEELERVRAELDASRQARDELHEEVERLRGEREQDRRTIAELTRLLARVESGAEAADGTSASDEEEPPETVAEAVRRAAAEAKHLRFAPRAFETAEDSPFRRPGLVLRTLRALDELAGRYEAGDMGKSLAQAAAEHGITQWKGDIAETTRKRYEDEYTFTYKGRRLWVGPHIGLGSGSGAQFIARIYLHVSDGSDPEVPRGIIVAVVGRHLPDTTT